MPKLPIFRLRSSEPPTLPDLQYYGPALSFTDLQLGVDNLRYDVFLRPRITADLSFHLGRYICRFGEVESLFAVDAAFGAQPKFSFSGEGASKMRKTGPPDIKAVMTSIHLAILNRASAEAHPSNYR